MSDPLYKTATIPAGNTGVTVFPVSPGRKVQLAVIDKGTGGVWDIVNYIATVTDNPNRNLFTSEEDQSEQYARTSLGGFKEVGINLKTPSSGDVVIELLEFKESK